MPKKFIVWGYPLHTHTHSYVHAAVEKAAKSLGYQTFWFSDENHPPPNKFDYSDSIFYTEGYADNKIPLIPDCVYFVHISKNLNKYLDSKCRLIEIRYDVTEINDINYRFERKPEMEQKISQAVSYVRDASSRDLVSYKGEERSYECLYVTWATDLLPEEIDLEKRFQNREKLIYWIGTIGNSNMKEFLPFANECQKNNISVIVSNPWSNPISFEQTMDLTRRSFLAPDIRGSGDDPSTTGTNHLKTGYVACRAFKNISYGQLGLVNSIRTHEYLGDLTIFSSDSVELFHLGMENMKNYNLIKEQMLFVRENHTWKKRLSDILRVI